jgi:hypothetical protein
LGDTLKGHFQNPASTVTGSGANAGKAGASTYEKKMGFLQAWVVAGMVVMPVKNVKSKNTPRKSV